MLKQEADVRAAKDCRAESRQEHKDQWKLCSKKGNTNQDPCSSNTKDSSGLRTMQETKGFIGNLMVKWPLTC